jgi:hypothetical protein
MKTVTKKILSLSIVPSIVLLNGCASSNNGEIINISDTHPYNNDYGVITSPEIEEQLKEELLAETKPIEIEIPQSDDPTLTTELKIDPDAFTAEEYKPKPPVITYKYMDDPIFYTANEIKEKNRLSPLNQK